MGDTLCGQGFSMTDTVWAWLLNESLSGRGFSMSPMSHCVGRASQLDIVGRTCQ